MKITRYKLQTNNQKSYQIVILADLHSNASPIVLQAVAKEAPDLIVIPGDCIDYTVSHAPQMLPFLQSLAKIAPTYYSDGNHELFKEEDICAVNETGVHFLFDQTIRHEELTIGGIASGFGFQKQGRWKKTPAPNADYLQEFANESGYKILLSHHPEYYKPYLKSLPIDLIISGHAHGGQWRIFGQGIFAPGQGILPRYTAGIHDNRFVISRGLGNHNIIPRIFNTPEIVVLQLNCAQ